MVQSASNCPRDKLGIALAGGGFRATIFHIGVLRRLAELDMLRYVEVISSVSGGSIIGALYVLLLKRELENPLNNGSLSQDCYIEIVDQLEQRLLQGIQKNPRTKLFMNPFALMYLLLTGGTLGSRMAHLYERYIYKDTISEIETQLIKTGKITKKRSWRCKGKIRLHEIKIFPAGYDTKKHDIESYNKEQVSKETGSVITKLVLNATTLNTGTRFFFTSSELGDWTYGYIREDEIKKVLSIKNIIEPNSENKLVKRCVRTFKILSNPLKWLAALFRCPGLLSNNKLKKAELFQYTDKECENIKQLYRWIKDKNDPALKLPEMWHQLILAHPYLSLLSSIDMGKLRKARVAAWHLNKIATSSKEESGGYNHEQQLDVLSTSLSEVFHMLPGEVSYVITNNLKNDIFGFIETIYLIRSASIISFDIRKDWDNLSLAQAVAISANFPPVFKPFRLTNIYDDAEVNRLGLTDGGIFDNLGVYGLIDENCNYMISSDTGKKMEIASSIPGDRGKMMLRIVDVLMEVDIKQTKQALLQRFNVSNGLGRLGKLIHDKPDTQKILEELNNIHLPRALPELAIFHIDSPQAQDALKEVPYVKGSEIVKAHIETYTSKDLAEIRTDLDAFGDIESAALINQGYINAELFLKHYFYPYNEDKTLTHRTMQYRYQQQSCAYPYFSANKEWPEAKVPNSQLCFMAETVAEPKAEEKRSNALVKWAVNAAKKRFCKWLSLPPFPSAIYISWTIVAATVAGFLFLASKVNFSLDGILAWITNAIKWMIPDANNWSAIPINLAELVIALVVLYALYKLASYIFELFIRLVDAIFKTNFKATGIWRNLVRFTVRMIRVSTYARDIIFAAIPAILASVVFTYIYFVFGLPYLWATSIKNKK